MDLGDDVFWNTDLTTAIDQQTRLDDMITRWKMGKQADGVSAALECFGV